MSFRARYSLIAVWATVAIVGYLVGVSLGRAEFADSLSGGPDFWEVTGVRASDALNLRKSPSPRAPTLALLGNGTVLRNLGCRMARGGRWCRVEAVDAAAKRGWVNGRYLRESAGPK